MVTPPASQEDIHKRLTAMKHRISIKKTAAGVLFNDIISENPTHIRMQKPLETIRDILQKQQDDEGNLDSDKIHWRFLQPANSRLFAVSIPYPI